MFHGHTIDSLVRVRLAAPQRVVIGGHLPGGSEPKQVRGLVKNVAGVVLHCFEKRSGQRGAVHRPEPKGHLSTTVLQA